MVEQIRQQLTALATASEGYTSVLLQGSGSYAVEAVLGSALGPQDKVLIVSNGAYGARMVEMAGLMGIAHHAYDCGEVARPDVQAIDAILNADPTISHIAMVHSETTTGMLNPIDEVGALAHRYGKTYIVDAMSSFGGIPMDIAALHIDYLISSANKCIQGVPGFAFVIAREQKLAACKGHSRSLSLDLYAQWRCMEDNHGKWRFTSPTHTVGVCTGAERAGERRWRSGTSSTLSAKSAQPVAGMRALGFNTLLDDELHSPIITAFIHRKTRSIALANFIAASKSRALLSISAKCRKATASASAILAKYMPPISRPC